MQFFKRVVNGSDAADHENDASGDDPAQVFFATCPAVRYDLAQLPEEMPR
jgi:hypothetical protein